MRNQRTQTLVETALSVALAVVLNFLAMRLPIHIAGGSLSLTMLPVAILAVRRGPLAGALGGALFGLLDLLIEPFILVPIQVVMDYPLPYLLFGLALGLFSGLYYKQGASAGSTTPSAEGNSGSIAKSSLILVLATLTGGILRLASHVLSGVWFFAEYAGDQNVWAYSVIYNITYIGPSVVACLLCLLALMPVLERAVPVQR